MSMALNTGNMVGTSEKGTLASKGQSTSDANFLRFVADPLGDLPMNHDSSYPSQITHF
jgi:hypothetical protein